jgi:subtilisin
MKKQVITLTILFLMAVSLLAPTVAVAKIDDTTRVIVGFKDFSSQGLIQANGWKINNEYHTIPAIACSLPTFAIDLLKKSPFVSYVEEDSVVALSDPDAEMAASWGVMKIGADVVQANGDLGEGVKVAVIDTGINYLHEDLDSNYVTGYNFVSKGSTPPMDDNGHGTHCAGIIAAEDNGIGVIGVAPKASLYALKVLNSAGSGYTSDIISAIQWAKDNGINVISMSLGSSVGSTALQQACDDAFNSGIVVVAAAGNNGAARTGSNINYPAKYANVIAVGATDQSNLRASFSCTGPELDLMAPGVNIISDYIDVTPNDGMNRDTLYMSGTSMAAPHVAGTAALIMASGEANEKAWGALGITDNDGKWSSSDVSKVLTATADDLGATGKDNLYGYGIVDADQTILAPNTPPTPSVVVNSFGITSPAGSSGGTVAPAESFKVTAQIHLNTDSSTPVSAMLTAPGYTIAEPATVTQTVGTSDVAFTWTVAAPSSALASTAFSVTASADGYGSGNSQFSVTTVAAASLSGSFTAPATKAVNVGDTITVTMRVTNTGTASATAVAPNPLTLISTGGGSATFATGPIPPSATILGGAFADFSWTYTASQTGTITFSGSASGTAQYSGLTIATGSVGPSNAVTINTPPPTPIDKIYNPTIVTYTRGTPTAGSVTSLAANDNTDLTVKSAYSSSYQTIDWYSSVTITEAKYKVTSLKVTYDGSYSKTQTQTLYVYNWGTKAWVSINSQSVGTTDKTFTSSGLSVANYISDTGQIQLRIYATQRTSTAFNCNADNVAFTITYTP